MPCRPATAPLDASPHSSIAASSGEGGDCYGGRRPRLVLGEREGRWLA